MTLSEIAIRRPVFAWVLMFGLIFFGALSFTKMGINENPDVDYPTVSINYSYEGASAEVVEKDIIEPVEGVLVTLEGIDSMTSVSSRGSGRITLEFELDRNIDFALQEVQTILGRAQRLIPDDVDPPTVTKSNADDDPIVIIGLSAPELSLRDLMLLFRDQVRDRFSTIEGVSEVRAFGYHEPMVRVDVSREKLRQYQLTINDVVSSIEREHKELPGGKLERGDTENILRIMGETTTVEDLKNLSITRRGGSPNYARLTLQDVATIEEGTENIKRLSRVNGKPALAMAVQKQRGSNAVATADAVKERLKVVNTELPRGSELFLSFDRTAFIRDSINELTYTLLLSA
ncbi:MAG: efflux RND transporter permease subunit, partial [Bdellovibrionales bacterium]|nr:efflux RND transporter permease subunit [Bdellovibrionales bacterium]